MRVTEEELHSVVERLRSQKTPFGNDPEAPTNEETKDPLGGKGRVYFTDPSGRFLEVCC